MADTGRFTQPVIFPSVPNRPDRSSISVSGVSVRRSGGVASAVSAPVYTAEPDPPAYINQVWPQASLRGPDAIPIVYGERIVQGRTIWRWPIELTIGGTSGFVTAGFVGLCGGPIDSVVSVFFEDWLDQESVEIPYDAGFDPATGVDGWFSKNGSTSQTEFAGSYYSGYGAAQHFPSLAYLACFVPQFMLMGGYPNPATRPWPGSVRARVKGLECLDTRTSTTAWTANPAVCLRDFLTNKTYGAGIDSSLIDDTSFETAADFCDTKSWTLNLVIEGDGNAQEWADTIAAHFGAKLYVADGLYKLWIDDVVSDSGILFNGSNSRDWELSETELIDRPTKVVVEYSRADNDWAPDQAISEDSTAAEVREASYRLLGVTGYAQAKALADRYRQVQALAPWRVEFVASAEAAKLSLGTRFSLTFTNGCTAENFIVTELEPLNTGEFKVVAREYNANSYNSAAAGGAPPTPPTPPDPPTDTPPDITIASTDYYEILTASSATQVTYDVYRQVNFTLPEYTYATELVVRGLVDAGGIGSDRAWGDLGDEFVIPLAGNVPGSQYSLFWPIRTGTKVYTYHPNGELAGNAFTYNAHQVTVRLRNILGLLSAGAIHRTAATALSNSSSADGGQGTLTGRVVKLLETTANGVNSWQITTPAALSADRTLTLPDSAPVIGVMAVDASGNVSFRKDFSFSAHKNGTDQTSISANTYTKITYGTESFDVGAGYDAANSKFLPGVSGKYLITAALALTPDATDSQLQIALYVNGALVKATNFNGSDSARLLSAVITSVLDLGASDYVEVYVRHQKSTDGTVNGSSSVTYFSGFRVG